MRRRRRRNKNEIRVVKKNRQRPKRPISKKARQRQRRVYRRRRILLLVVALFIIVLPISLLIKKLNSYNKFGYPSFRDEVLKGLTENIFVGDTEGRSLSTDEKLADYDKLYESVVRNYPVSKENEAQFKDFVKSKDKIRKRIANSKTDEEFFDLIDESLDILDDNYSFILDKNSYTNLFNYYRNKDKSKRAEIFGNDQAVARYARMINKEKIKKDMTIDRSDDKTLIIRLPDFNMNKLDEDLDAIADALEKSNAESIVFDLSNNNSIDYSYVNEFISYFLDKDYEKKDLYFYRGWLFEQTLDDIKSSKESLYKTSKAKNLASKYRDSVEKIDLENYQYYDQVELRIKKKDNFRKRDLYVLTNDISSNEAIRFAKILKDQGAFLIKNGLDSSMSKLDKVKNTPADFILLDHSGLIASISSSISLKEEKYLEYDHRINTEDPYKAILELIK